MYPYSLPWFGELDLINLNGLYNANLELNGRTIELELNFDNKIIHPERLDLVKQFIEHLSTHDDASKAYIEQYYAANNNNLVKTFVDLHLNVFERKWIAGAVEFNNQSTPPDKQLLQSLGLIKVWIYAEREDSFAVLHYAINGEPRKDLIVVYMDEHGRHNGITLDT